MAIRKPSDYFNNENNSIEETIQGNAKNSELNTFSDAYNAFKRNLSKVDVLNNFSETLGNYQDNVEKVNYLSEKIDEIDKDIKNLLTKEDLDKALISQLLFLEECIRDVQEKVKGINHKNLTQVKLDISSLSETVNVFIDEEIPRYKKLVFESETRLTDKCEVLEDELKDTLDNIKVFIDEKYVEDFKSLNEEIDKIKTNDIPKYKNLIVDSEIKTDSKIKEFAEVFDNTVNDIVSKIELVKEDNTEIFDTLNSKVNEVNQIHNLMLNDIEKSENTRDELDKKIVDLEVEILRNESHIENQNKNIEDIHGDVKSAIDRLNIGKIEENNFKLGEKIKYLEEVFEKFNEKELLSENIITEPSSTDNNDSLTPLDKNFVTLDQLQNHYRLFINRIQQQLASLGGGGEVRLEFLDDVDRDSAKVNGKFLKYDSASGKWVGANASGGASSQTLDETLGLGNTSSRGMSVGVVTSTKLHVDSVGSGVTFNEDLVVVGDARVTGILSIGTSSIVLDPNAKTISGVEELQVGETTIKNDSEGNITFVNTFNPTQTINVGIGSTASVNTTGIITASSFTGSLIGTATNATNLNNQAASYYLDYNNLSNKPTIPARTSDLVNDSGFVTSSVVAGYATEGFVNSAVAGIVSSAPATLDTLNELAQALGDDANFSATVTNLIGTKASLSGATFTGIVTAPSFSGDGSSLTNIDAATLDGLDSTQFLRSDQGDITTGNITISNTQPTLVLEDTDGVDEFAVINAGGSFIIRNQTDARNDFSIGAGGAINANGILRAKAGLNVTGNIVVSGTVDGRDVAADGTKLDGVASNATAYGDSDVDSHLNRTQQVSQNYVLSWDGQDYAWVAQSGGGGVSEAFKTIAVSGQSDVVADSATDTLTLVAGNNMTITTNASGDSITFASSGGGGGGGISNVVEDTTPQLGGNLDLNSKDITGTGNLNVSGIVTATSFSGSGASLTAVDAATLDGIDSSSFLRSDATDVKSSGNLTFNDNVQARFGNSGDLNIFHNGSNSFISNTLTGGNLVLQSYSDSDVAIRADSGSGGFGLADYVRAVGTTGEVILSHYGSEKLATKSGGVTVTGHTETDTLRVSGVSTFGNVHLGDNDRLRIGDGNDLELYHDGTDDLIRSSGTTLKITGTRVVVNNAANNENQAVFTAGGSVALYHNASKKFETTASGIDVTGLTETDTLNVSGISTFQNNIKLTTDNKKLIFGSGDDLEIFHDGSNNYVVANNGSFTIKTPAFNYLKTSSSTGRVQLFYDNSLKFETTGAGVTVFGTTETQQLNVTGISTFTGATNHTFTNITRSSNGVALQLRNTSTANNAHVDQRFVIDGNSRAGFRGQINGANLGGLLRFYTAADTQVLTERAVIDHQGRFGINVTSPTKTLDVGGNGQFTGNVTVLGTTQTQQLNVSGVSTFQGNVHLGDDDELRFGANNDFKIVHDPNDCRFENSNGDIKFKNTGSYFFFDEDGGETLASFVNDGAVNLFYGGSKKFQTTGMGVSIINGTSDTATITGPSNLVIDPAVVGDNTGIVRIKGDLFVDGTTTQINSTSLEIADFIVGIASTATTDLLTDGAGIQIGPDNTFLYEHNGGNNPSLKSSENLNVASGKGYQIAETERLSADTLSLGTGTTIHSPASNVLTLGTNSEERVRITSNGDLTSTGPNNSFATIKYSSNFTKLDLRGTGIGDSKHYIIGYGAGHGSADSFHMVNATSTGNLVFRTGSSSIERLRIDSSGRIGINRIPNSKLDILNGSDDNIIVMVRGADATSEYAAMGVNEGNAIITGGSSGNDNVGIVFRTASSGTEAEKFRITSDGKFGFGTNNPQGTVHISSGTSGDATLILEADTDNSNDLDNPYIVFRQDGGINASAIGHGVDSGVDGNVLTIANSISDGSITFATGSTNGYANATERVRIDSDGDVGVGIADPKTKLHVARVIMATGATPQIRLNANDSDLSDDDRTMLGQATGNGHFVNTAVDNDTILRGTTTGNLLFGVGTEEKFRITSDGKFGFGTGANIDERGHIETASGNCRLKIQTGDTTVAGFVLQTSAKRFDIQAQNDFFQVYDSTAATERLRISSAGRVGIGEDNPTRKLVVKGSGNTSVSIKAGTSDAVALLFGDTDNDARGLIRYDNNGDSLQLWTAGTEKLRITSAGLVGIGTDNPNTLLHLHSTNPTLRLTDSNQSADNKSWNITAGQTQLLRIQAINDSGTGGGKLFDFYRSGTQVEKLLGRSGTQYWFEVNNTTKKVGIGTENPATTLEVAGTGSPTIRVTDLDGTNQFGQILSNNGTFVIESRNDTSDGQIIFRGRDNTGTNEYARFDENGNLGIGTNNPQTKVQINDVYGIETESSSFTASAGVAYTANTYTASDFVNAEYTLFFQHSSGIQSQKVLVMDDGSTAYSQEYGIMSSNGLLVSVGATVKSNNVELLFTPETGVTGIVTYRFTRGTMI